MSSLLARCPHYFDTVGYYTVGADMGAIVRAFRPDTRTPVYTEWCVRGSRHYDRHHADIVDNASVLAALQQGKTSAARVAHGKSTMNSEGAPSSLPPAGAIKATRLAIPGYFLAYTSVGIPVVSLRLLSVSDKGGGEIEGEIQYSRHTSQGPCFDPLQRYPARTVVRSDLEMAALLDHVIQHLDGYSSGVGPLAELASADQAATRDTLYSSLQAYFDRVHRGVEPSASPDPISPVIGTSNPSMPLAF